MSKNYNTRTASLKATIANIRNLDAKKIVLDNKDIIDHIKENAPTIKHSQDTRETVYENDLWGLWVETKDDGTIIIHDDWVTNPHYTPSVPGGGLIPISSAWLSNVKAVYNNEAYSEITTDAEGNFTGIVWDSIIANIQTERIRIGGYMFNSNPLASFSGDLSSLTDGHAMFSSTKLTSFSGDLSSLIKGNSMFSYAALTSFNSDLSSLINGAGMFYFTKLTSFSSDLSSLVDGYMMFDACTSLTSFNSDLSSLVEGDSMFNKCTALTSFSGDLSSLVGGDSMFNKTSLTPKSVMYIVESIRNITEEKAKYTSGEIPWVTYDYTTEKYSAPFGFKENGAYVYTYNYPKPYTDTIAISEVGKLTLGINVTNDPDTIAQQLQTFAEGCLYESWDKLVQAFTDKGWAVTFQYGGTTTAITLPEEGE